MSDIEIIEAPKQLAISAQLTGIASEFQRTGNLSVQVAFTNGSWTEAGDTGHAQIILASGRDENSS